jgi:glycosyl-4,4'-diaponeurosporenoate acyltransferase
MVPVYHPSAWAMLVTDVVAWGVIHGGTGYIAHRLPESLCRRDTWLTRRRRFERSGRIWRTLRVHRWKDRLPEAGDTFRGGVSKRHLPGRDDQGLLEFAALTRRAEMGHWMAAAASPVFAIWNPPWIAIVMVCYGVAVNAPFIAIQRYNRLRVDAAIGRRAAARARNRRGTSGSSMP